MEYIHYTKAFSEMQEQIFTITEQRIHREYKCMFMVIHSGLFVGVGGLVATSVTFGI